MSILLAKAGDSLKAPVTYGLCIHEGFLLNHSPSRTDVSSMVLSGMRGLEASMQWQTLGKKKWHRSFGYPKWGLSLMYYHVNDRVIKDTLVKWGDGLALLIHVSAGIIKTKYVELNLRLGTGLGGFSQNYHPTDNPKNLWLSSPVNTAMHLNVETQFNLSPQWHLVLGGTFTHYSNGATKMPNLGVNFPSINVGLRYTPYPIGHVRVDPGDSLSGTYAKNHLFLTAGIGAKVIAEFGTTYYTTYATSIHYGRDVGRISRLLVGVDGFVDNSLYATDDDAKNGADIKRFGVFAGHELLLGRLGMIAGMGYYAYNKTKRDASTYIKVGLRYMITKHIMAGVYLKTHYGQADCLEWTVGYKF